MFSLIFVLVIYKYKTIIDNNYKISGDIPYITSVRLSLRHLTFVLYSLL